MSKNMTGNSESISKKIIGALKQMSVEPYLFFTALGLYTSMVPMQSLMMDRACRNTLDYPDTICDDMDHHKIEQERSIEVGNNYYSGILFVTSLPAVFVSIFMGPWSDKYTRRLPLLLSASGLFVESVAIVILTVASSVPPAAYVATSVLSGLTGGFLVCMSASGSYLSDITDERSRAARFAVMDCFLIAANVLGNVLGGQIFKMYGYVTVLCVGPCVYFCAILYALLILKETKPPVEPGKRLDMFRDFITMDNIKQSYHTCIKKRHGNIRLQLWLLIFVQTSVMFVTLGFLGVAFSFAKQMYKMSVPEFSNVNIIFSVVNALVTLVVVPLFTQKLMLHEAAVGLIGMLSNIARAVLSSVAFTQLYFYYAMISGVFYNCSTIAVSSRLSKLVEREELGRAFAILGMFTAFAPMLGTATFLQIFNASQSFYPGLVFALASIFLLPSALIFWWMMRLPTVSVAQYAKEEGVQTARPLKIISTNYNRLEEDSTQN